MSERVRKKKKYRINYKRAAISLSLLIIVVTIIFSLVPAWLGIGTSYDRDLIRTCGDPQAKAPSLKAECAILYSVDMDRAVYEKKADQKMPPYSMTKILTCYLALENLAPDDVVTVSKNATKELEDGMEMELIPGEKLKAIDLIYATMMMSANDAATALGEAVAGTESAFADLMNKTAAEWGCQNTHFVNANGWEDKDHYTTARDMAIITMHCLENETLRKISMTKEYTVPASNKNDELELDNAFLKTTSNIDVQTGGKTGTWSENECSITLEFSDKGLTEIIVLLGDTVNGRLKDPKKLVKFAPEVTPGFKVTDSDKNVCEAWVKHGAEVKVPLYVKGLRYAYPQSEKASGVKVKTEVKKLKAPVKKGDKAGTYYIYANDEVVGKGTLYVAEDVEPGWFLSYLYVPNMRTLLLFTLVFLILALGLVMHKNTRTAEDKREELRNKRNYKARH